MATLAAHFPPCPPRAGSTPPPAAAREALGLRALGALDARQAPRRARRAGRRRRRAARIAGARSRRPTPALDGARMTACDDPRRRPPATLRRRRRAAGATSSKFGRMIKFEPHACSRCRSRWPRPRIAARGHGLSRRARSPASSSPWRARARPRWDSTASSTATSTRATRAPPGASCPAGAISLRAAWALTAGQRRRVRGRRRRARARSAWRWRRSRSRSCSATRSPSASRSLCHLFLGLAIAGGPGRRLDRRARRLRLGARPA